MEHYVVPGIVENLKIITAKACENITKYAFEYARKHNRKRVTCCHKAGVMKLGDGCFLDVFHRVAKDYPDIKIDTK